MSVLNFITTTAGNGAFWNPEYSGLDVDLTHVQFGSGNRIPDGSETALVTPMQFVALGNGAKVSSTQIKLAAVVQGLSNYNISEIGIWSGAPGTPGAVLVFYWSQASGSVAAIVEGIELLWTHDLVIDGSGIGGINIVVDATAALSQAIFNQMVDGTTPAGKANKLTTARNITVGASSKAFDGSAPIGFSIAEIFAANQAQKTFLAAPSGTNGTPSFRSIISSDLPSDLSLSGNPTVLTQDPGNNSQRIANTAFVQAAIAALVSSSPAALDTLNELATALGNDPNFASTVTTALGNKQPLHAVLTAISGVTLTPNRGFIVDGGGAVALGKVVRSFSKSSLPGSNIGPIMIDELGGEAWIWSTFSTYYTGYASPFCGYPIYGVDATPRAHEIEAIGGVFNKADYPQLWAWAQARGLVTSQVAFDAGLGSYWFVADPGGDATKFRAPNLLGPNNWGMFLRMAAGGVDADTANAVALGSRKLDTFKAHSHEAVTSFIAGGAGNRARANDATSDNTQTGSTGTAETAPRHVAFHPRIHV